MVWHTFADLNSHHNTYSYRDDIYLNSPIKLTGLWPAIPISLHHHAYPAISGHGCLQTRAHAHTHTQVPKQVDCNMCRFSKLLLFSFFFCKDGSDRQMKRASYSCCNFLCIVLAAAYLKYRLCRLPCLPFVWHPFFSVTHTHTIWKKLTSKKEACLLRWNNRDASRIRRNDPINTELVPLSSAIWQSDSHWNVGVPCPWNVAQVTQILHDVPWSSVTVFPDQCSVTAIHFSSNISFVKLEIWSTDNGTSSSVRVRTNTPGSFKGHWSAKWNNKERTTQSANMAWYKLIYIVILIFVQCTQAKMWKTFDERSTVNFEAALTHQKIELLPKILFMLQLQKGQSQNTSFFHKSTKPHSGGKWLLATSLNKSIFPTKLAKPTQSAWGQSPMAHRYHFGVFRSFAFTWRWRGWMELRQRLSEVCTSGGRRVHARLCGVLRCRCVSEAQFPPNQNQK